SPGRSCAPLRASGRPLTCTCPASRSSRACPPSSASPASFRNWPSRIGCCATGTSWIGGRLTFPILPLTVCRSPIASDTVSPVLSVLELHEIAEADHRILNPFTDAHLMELAAVARVGPGTRVLDL